MSGSDSLEASAQLARTAAALRSGDVGFVEAVRRIVWLRQPLGVTDHDPDFAIFIAIDSESDHLPNLTAKLMATDEWLAACVAEERELQERHGEAVRAAAERLCIRFASQG